MTNATAAQVQVIAGVLGAPIETADLALQAAAPGTRAEVAASLILAALAADGYEVVKVSDPDETYMVTGGEIAENGEWYAYVRVPQALLDGVILDDFPTLGPAIAQGLLAAARHAEAGQ